MALFALDHNFPEPIVEVLATFQADAELVPVIDVDPRMSELDDWELLLALHHHAAPWDGLITTDSTMLNRAREMATLMRLRLTLVVAMEAGHNPVKASGLLFAYLSGICQRTRPDVAQVWTLRAANRAAENPWDYLTRAANHQSRNPSDLFNEARPSDEELADNPLTDEWGPS